ncbi:MAG: glutamate--cysteine ligase [Microbacterium sp.]|uniref:glutamate--cysteine ligase n=1 Tax=Microbacterium sp. TaxID=51671 RepID=UPI003BAFB1F3
MSTPVLPGAGEQASPSSRVTGDATGTRLIGVEEELLLVSSETMLPAPSSTDVLNAHATGGQTAEKIVLETEVKLEQIEVVSPPLATYQELLDAIRSGRRTADDAALVMGARVVALATAPVLCDSHIVSSPRYDRMSERFALTMAEQLTCGFHVHVSIGSPEEGVAVLDRIRIWLPLLLALSANSPFWRGVDSGYASYRYQAWGRWPSAGPYDRFGSAAAYSATIGQMLETGVSLDPGMIYFDARLSMHAPTVEIRIADICMEAEDAATLAVITRALVSAAAAEWRAGVPAPDVATSLLRLASWRASRFGMSEKLLDPPSGAPRSAAECARALLTHIDDHFSSREEADLARRGVREIMARGNGAVRQRAVMAERSSWTEMVADAVMRTHARTVAR